MKWELFLVKSTQGRYLHLYVLSSQGSPKQLVPSHRLLRQILLEQKGGSRESQCEKPRPVIIKQHSHWVRPFSAVFTFTWAEFSEKKHIFNLSLALFHTHTPHTQFLIQNAKNSASRPMAGPWLLLRDCFPTASLTLGIIPSKHSFPSPPSLPHRSQDFNEKQWRCHKHYWIWCSLRFFFLTTEVSKFDMYLHGSLTFTFETEQCLSVDDSRWSLESLIVKVIMDIIEHWLYSWHPTPTTPCEVVKNHYYLLLTRKLGICMANNLKQYKHIFHTKPCSHFDAIDFPKLI